jgi:anti-sigma regulatory factor (Ser/Thr protein kinase)
MAASLGFSETKQGRIAIITTELANNLLLHAIRGELFICRQEFNKVLGLEITAIDNGPGMSDFAQCLRDGYSTAGTPGNGLGAVSRLSERCDVYSLSTGGTVLAVQVLAEPLRTKNMDQMTIGVLTRPKPRQEVCGDTWAIEHLPGRCVLLLADGLGHGPEAAAASQTAARSFRKHARERPHEILSAIHTACHGTRGSALAVADVNFQKQEVSFIGIGNIAGTIVSAEQSQSLVSYNGIVGHQIRKYQEFVYPWRSHSLLVLHSDGLSGRWQLDKYPGLMYRHPSLIAGVLYRDFQRDNDDATVVVATEAFRS